MKSATRYFECDNGHEFGVTNWGTPPLCCPRCKAAYKPQGTRRRQVVVETATFGAYGAVLAFLVAMQW